jgi:aspartate/methionine/tyrosine aminotransferase
MASYLDDVPFSGIIRIRDMMYSVSNPYRLDQGDVSFDAPDSVKAGMARAIAENHSHYVQTTGIPRLRELIAAKLRNTNGIPIDDVEDVLVTNGGIHGLYILTLEYLERLATLAHTHNLWVISDEAYEDVVFDGEHISIASLPGMYNRTFPLYTFSKTYAMTGLRLGYIAIKNPAIRDRAKKLLFYTASNVASVVQYGGIGALEGSQDCVEAFREELRARRDLFYQGIRESAGDIFSGQPPAGAFYAFLRIAPGWLEGNPESASVSWRMVEYLIAKGRIGCVPGVDFGANGEGYVRFCFARDRKELMGALESLKELLSVTAKAR